MFMTTQTFTMGPEWGKCEVSGTLDDRNLASVAVKTNCGTPEEKVTEFPVVAADFLPAVADSLKNMHYAHQRRKAFLEGTPPPKDDAPVDPDDEDETEF